MIRLSVDKSFCHHLSKVEQNFGQPIGQVVTWCYEAKFVAPEVKDSTDNMAIIGLVRGVHSDIFEAKREVKILHIRVYNCEEGHIAAYRFDLELGELYEKDLLIAAGYLVNIEDWE